MKAVSTYLESLRPDANRLMQNMQWQETGRAICTGCSISDRFFENLATRPWQNLSGIITILAAVAIIASSGSLIGGAILGVLGLGILAHRLLTLPNCLSFKVYMDSWMVNIIGKQNIHDVPIIPRGQREINTPFAVTSDIVYAGFGSLCCGSDTATVPVYWFKYEIHQASSPISVVTDLISVDTGIDPEYRSSRGDRSQIGGYNELSSFGWGIASNRPEKMAKIIDRLTRLLNGEKVGILDDKGNEQPVLDTTYVQLVKTN